MEHFGEEMARNDVPSTSEVAFITFRAEDADAAALAILDYCEANSWRVRRYSVDIDQHWGSVTAARYDLPKVDALSAIREMHGAIADGSIRTRVQLRTVQGVAHAHYDQHAALLVGWGTSVLAAIPAADNEVADTTAPDPDARRA